MQKTENWGEYNHALATRLINDLETTKENKEIALSWDKAQFAGGAKPSTRANKMQALRQLLAWADGKNIKEFDADTLINFRQYLETTKYSIKGSKPRKYSKQSTKNRLSTLKQFYGWLGKPEAMQWFKAKRELHGRLTAQEILSQKEILRLITAANSKRDKALISALWETGARAGEFLPLKIKDLHIDGNTISLTVDGKTGKRQAFLVASVPAMLQWLEEHPQKNNPEAMLWEKGTHKNGSRLTNNALRAMLLATAKRAGITKPCFAHALRHSRATFAAKSGQNEMVMREIFGWSRISEMPSIYISLCGKDLKDAALELAGVQKAEEAEPILKPKVCVRCGTVAPIDGMVCQRCFFPLNAEGAKVQEEKEVSRMEAMINAALDARESKATTKAP